MKYAVTARDIPRVTHPPPDYPLCHFRIYPPFTRRDSPHGDPLVIGGPGAGGAVQTVVDTLLQGVTALLMPLMVNSGGGKES